MKNLIAIFALLALYSCSSKTTVQTATTTADSPAVLQLTGQQLHTITLSTTRLQEQSITQTLKLNGTIDVPPQNLVSVSAALGGYLKSTKLLPGMHFRKGEVLAVLEDNQYIQLQQDYLTAKAQLEQAHAEYLRQKDLNASKASSDKDMQQAKAAYETWQISKKALEEKLRLINIHPGNVSVANISRTVQLYAPFDGYVSRVLVNTGKYIAPSEVLFELVNPQDLHLQLKVFEKDLGAVQTGQPLVAYTNSNPGKKYEGQIILIGKNLSADRALEVHAHLKQYDELLIPGLYMNAEIEIPGSPVAVLPDACLLTFEGQHYVFKALDKDRFELVAVQTGSAGNGWTEIKNPERIRDANIVQSGAYTLLMALKNKGAE